MLIPIMYLMMFYGYNVLNNKSDNRIPDLNIILHVIVIIRIF